MCALFLSGPFRRVGWFRRSVCSPPPPALFLAVGPSCVRFFLPLAFQGFPGSAGCVCNKTSFFFLPSSPFLNNAGGSSTIASLLPTKTLAIGGDTRPDQSGVPAIFHCDGKGLSQVPQCYQICFSSNLHVTGFSSCRITTMIHSYLVCVCVSSGSIISRRKKQRSHFGAARRTLLARN